LSHLWKGETEEDDALLGEEGGAVEELRRKESVAKVL
jgi:hypothetical protein